MPVEGVVVVLSAGVGFPRFYENKRKKSRIAAARRRKGFLPNDSEIREVAREDDRGAF